MHRFVIGCLLLLAGIAAQGQGGMRHGRMAQHEHGHASMARHHYVRQHGLDAQYALKRKPREPTAEDVAGGQASFALYCASCHGERGRGDGAAGAGLNPPPADLVAGVRRPIASDAYLYWTIAEGGVPVESAMPPFKDVLTEDAIWAIIAYLREL